MLRTINALLSVASFFLALAVQAHPNHDELRLYNKLTYKVLDTYGFVIYSKDVHVTGSKARVTERRYFFSRNVRSEIKPLTINNLKHEFPDREFHDLLDIYFKNNHDLTRYDRFSKEYKLKYVFRKAFAGYKL